MTKAELIERISRNRDLPPDITKKCIAEILDVTFDELATYFTRAKVTRSASPRFAFPGFGTFTKKKRSARRGVNPRTLEPMEIDASATLDFKPAGALKQAMNSPKDAVRTRAAKKKKSAAKKGAAAASTPKKKKKAAESRRPRLRPREEVELESLDDAGLPETPLRRTGRGGRRNVGRTG